MVTSANAGPNFGRSIRIKQGGPKVMITDMTNNHVLNYQHYLRALIWHCDTYNEAYSGNIKSKEDAEETLGWMTDELNERGLTQYPRKSDYIRQKQAEYRAKKQNRVWKVAKAPKLRLTKKQAKKIIDALPDNATLGLDI